MSDDINSFEHSVSDSSDDDQSHEQEENEDRPSNFYKLRKRRYESTSLSLSTTTGTSDDSGSETAMEKKSTADMPGLNNPKVMRMMEKMNYNPGKGLGKQEQGIVEPIQASKQKGRRGIGLELTGLTQSGLTYDPSEEEVNAREYVEWIACENRQKFSTSEMLGHWIQVSDRKDTIDNEIQFCNPNILRDILNNKTVFDKLDDKEKRTARSRSNPFELIRGVFFLNRAAMKMANMDAALDFMFTTPRNTEGDEVVGDNELLYFADVCAGPGGFSEYVLWRKKWRAKGFGFTLKGEHDFRLDDFFAAPSETFEPYYGTYDDGDVYKKENIFSLQQFVKEKTDGKGVHFMMADGGFSVDGQENIQEVLSKRLYLCQCLVALLIVRAEGHFVVKLFDLFTPFSVGLVYLMYQSFREVAIIKPNTSRPANSERYLVCKHKLEDIDAVATYLNKINMKLETLQDTSEDIIEIVPTELLKQDMDFFNYIYDSNNRIGRQQVVSLAKIAAFCENNSLVESRQQELRSKCLELWGIPDQTRKVPRAYDPHKKTLDLLNCSPEELSKSLRVSELDKPTMEQDLKKKGLYQCCPLTDKPTYFIGLGGPRVYRYEGNQWVKVPGVELVRDTLVLGDYVKEHEGKGSSQKHKSYLHIIDVCHIFEERLSHFRFDKRREICELYVRAISKTGNCVRLKEMVFPDENNLLNFMNGVNLMDFKSNKNTLGLALEPNLFIRPKGLLFYCVYRDPWVKALSKTHGKYYFFNTKTQHKFFEDEKEDEKNRMMREHVIVHFKNSIEKSFYWNWEGCSLWLEREGPPSKVNIRDMLDFLSK